MLSTFVIENRAEIIRRCGAKVAVRMGHASSEITNGVPLLLDQLVEILIAKQHGAKAVTAGGTTHGSELLHNGFTIGQVVHDYGDVCQATTELAVEQAEPISAEEFQLLNLCLDDAIAAAVTEFARRRELEVAADGRDRATGDLGLLSYELGNLVWSAALAFDALQTGSVGVSGTTGAVVARSLDSLRNLVDRAFAVMKLKSRGGTSEPISVGELIDRVKLSVRAPAQGPRLAFEVHDADAVVEADFIFGRHTGVHGRVAVRSSATAACVRIEIEDQCGGERSARASRRSARGSGGQPRPPRRCRGLRMRAEAPVPPRAQRA